MPKFCSECGSPLITKPSGNDGEIPYCPVCKKHFFPLYNVAVSIITVDEQTGKILLIHQYNKPHYILVAGYVNRGESAEEAVARELKEETGLDAVKIHFNRTAFFEPSNTLMCNFTARVDNAADIRLNEEVDSFEWFSPDQVYQNMKPTTLAAKFVKAYLTDTETDRI